ncbi:PREDICTED: probable glutathione S-transferase [Fragaria vesca subsp. vesca]|uniref:probable glutathione S-transferase n=1 Tax=Fragaria vesca subsp. vesca TaxID=101020 RepID=UPI0002C2FF56|nr:PREDICTED: probable glutathione S-transferase [Fragaria vesca subsp. vesca]
MGGVKLVATTQSFFCTRVQWALKLKGVEYEFIEEDLRNKSPVLLKYNPVHKKVPVLVHHDTPIVESLVILEYIDETWKENPLLPQDPFDRAAARFWAKFADEKVVFGVWTACTAEGEGKEKAIEAALESLAHLEKQIEGKKFFGGEQIGYLDLVLGWIPHWLNTVEEVGGMKLLEAERFPCLLEWGQNFIHTPFIKECIPQREKLIEYLSASIIYLRSLAAQKP